jgi:zinc protease
LNARTSPAPASPAPTSPIADLSVLDVRPLPGTPREYHFPRFERTRLATGLTVITAHLPGRPLLAAQLLLAGGGEAEGPEQAGVTVLTGRALPEGTLEHDGVAFIEAAERLGADIHAEAGWEAVSATLEVPRSHFAPALALLAEMVIEPSLPAAEVARLRDERLNDLLQAWNDPRRRAERVFPETIYDPAGPYFRPLGGTQTTVRRLEREEVAARHRSVLAGGEATLIVAGDLTGLDVARLAEERFAGLSAAGLAAAGGADPARPEPVARPAADRPRAVIVDRPGAPQTELRIGHVGLARRTPDYHAVAVMNAILGGIFSSRLNRLIREQLGYTYGIHSGYDMRRGAGPFVVRTAVETGVTTPAIVETLGVLRAMSQEPPTAEELDNVRDYLVGVFPLRFETPAQVAAALSGLVVFELPDDELDRYRPAVAAVSADDVVAAAKRYVRTDEMSIVVVGDAAAIEPPLRSAELAPLTVVAADMPAS